MPPPPPLSPPSPQKTAIFFNDHPMAARHEEGCHQNNAFSYIHVFICEGLLVVSNDDVGVGWQGAL